MHLISKYMKHFHVAQKHVLRDFFQIYLDIIRTLSIDL